MNTFPTAKMLNFNPMGRRSVFKANKEAQSGRMGFGWSGNFGPYGGNNGPYDDNGTNNGPYVNGGNNGPYRCAVGMGYHPDLPDFRDYCLDQHPDKWPAELRKAVDTIIETIKRENALRDLSAEGKKTISDSKIKEAGKKYSSYILRERHDLPAEYDLRNTEYFTPVEFQGEIGSCTANAVIGLVEYLMKAGGNPKPEMSRLFLYKLSRRLLGWTGDSGSYLRTTIKAMALFGVPPESEWPYFQEHFDDEPQAYHFAFAQNFKAMSYARLDGYGPGNDTLDTVKRTLLDGFPVAFGFPVYSSIDKVDSNNKFVIPIPRRTDRNIGGHAVLAVGFDNDILVDINAQGKEIRGALIIRNSWGTDWGMDGYAYLPYAYCENKWAVDFWTIFNKDWLLLDRFE